MGIVKKPSIRSYWSMKKLIATPGIMELIHLKRFFLIKKYLRLYPFDRPKYQKFVECEEILSELYRI